MPGRSSAGKHARDQVSCIDRAGRTDGRVASHVDDIICFETETSDEYLVPARLLDFNSTSKRTRDEMARQDVKSACLCLCC